MLEARQKFEQEHSGGVQDKLFNISEDLSLCHGVPQTYYLLIYFYNQKTRKWPYLSTSSRRDALAT